MKRVAADGLFAECEAPHIPCGLALVNITMRGMAMNPDKIWESVSRIYDQVEIALWALLLSGTICFFTVANFPQIWARVEGIRAQETENAYYCEKLGMKAATQKFARRSALPKTDISISTRAHGSSTI